MQYVWQNTSINYLNTWNYFTCVKGGELYIISYPTSTLKLIGLVCLLIENWYIHVDFDVHVRIVVVYDSDCMLVTYYLCDHCSKVIRELP